MAGQARSLQRVTASVGAVLGGYDLRRPLPPGQADELRRALADHGVIFFRGQDLSDEEMGTFVSCFGQLQPSHAARGEAQPVTTGNLGPTRYSTAVWHADVTWIPAPPIATALRAVKLPPVGGDTCWVSTEAAYDALSEPFRRMLDGLTAVHSMQPTLDREPALAGYLDKGAAVMESVHPVVRVHPVSGRKSLYVNECSTVRIVELSAAESAAVLGVLFAHIRSPHFSLRWHWSPNDVAICDNRNTQHFAVPDYAEERVMQRAQLAGEVPVGPA
jgi:taurine dioxygenase